MSDTGRCVTLATTVSVQNYLFRSNRLSENAGASYLVEEAFKDLGGKNRGSRIYVGGGGAAFVFPSRSAAVDAIKTWSRDWLIDKAPGLRVAVCHQSVERSLRRAYLKAQQQLKQNEDKAPFGAWPGALPVVRECTSTGLAAECESYGSWVSREALTKRDKAKKSRDQAHDKYFNVLRARTFPEELEDLGSVEGSSHIAVVHADGDGIGELFRRTALNCSDEDDEFFRNQMFSLSESVKGLEREAFGATIAELIQYQEAHSEARDVWVRPLVEAGDDLTFVTKGKLGVALTVRYLRHFRDMSRHWLADFAETKGQAWSACAGVAIVPGKFPFARAYHLAEQLAGGAKAKRRELLNAGATGPDACWIDFQPILEASADTLTKTRDLMYGLAQSQLQRPYCIAGARDAAYNWQRFEWMWKEFGKWPRSRAKELFEALPRGAAVTDETVTLASAAGWSTPAAQNRPAFLETSTVSAAEYWDPLEMLDLHEDLAPGRGKTNAAARD
ncbi:MAG TPA: hypothetical protein VKU01_23265 [Bryobacteraceae bacterium]|nr:hypothetical protein [Bryobacteraceae bacterium]